ncbi:NAD(P)-dependent oxidoreductase [Membranicola marinus]|uniref:NAD(P)-dependent oxidoreductase n=1 Tax=Membranihabitans marinus TaxID=1227546 RepID=A0A953HVN1_9BACT|nr:NAD(P)-dependent oxidoreductase [Membranihabitans marinus]MBY5956627.1 NAD(P)-dependent oxidoreductase [Membranihabitans marinus]
MNVLVTGGAGYIGTSLVDKLNTNPLIEKIIVYDNMSHNNIRFFFGNINLEKVRFVQGDILNHIALQKVLKDIDVIYHLAGVVKSPYSMEDSLKYEQINQWGTANLIQCLEKFKQVQKFIFVSSASVYGFAPVDNEFMEANPMNTYGRSKREAEKFVQLLEENMQVDILRVGNVFGYNRTVRHDSVINRFIFEALCYGQIQIFGNGNQVRPFVHIHHLTELLNDLLEPIQDHSDLRLNNVLQFNHSINGIRDILEKEIETLDYIYINQGHEVPSLEIQDDHLLEEDEIQKLLRKEIQTFRNRFVLS